jgi:hypothetical protein
MECTNARTEDDYKIAPIAQSIIRSIIIQVIAINACMEAHTALSHLQSEGCKSSLPSDGTAFLSPCCYIYLDKLRDKDKL